MNIRSILNFQDGYYNINREERNLAAIFYHTLLLGNNLQTFLDKIGCEFPIVDKEVGIYFEYAFVRDLWNQIGEDNYLKRKLILDLLKPLNSEELEGKSVFEFNQYFGAVPVPSHTYIQSPGNWSISYFNQNITDNDEFLKVCEFKWCFNAKPDIVIHTSHETAICIEAKFESNEGKYPSKEAERKIFSTRDRKLVGQLHIQKKLMEELLGIRTKYIFLVQKKSENETHETLTWKEAFEDLEISTCPHFIKEWLGKPCINLNMV